MDKICYGPTRFEPLPNPSGLPILPPVVLVTILIENTKTARKIMEINNKETYMKNESLFLVTNIPSL